MPISTVGSWIFAAFAIFAFVNVGMALAMRRPRLEMARISEKMMRDPDVSVVRKRRVTHLMETCFSFKVVLLLPVAAAAVLIDDLLKIESLPDDDDAPIDDSYHRLIRYYLLSVLAANPLFAVVSVPVVIVCLLLAALSSSISPGPRPANYTLGFEVSTLKASAAVA